LQHSLAVIPGPEAGALERSGVGASGEFSAIVWEERKEEVEYGDGASATSPGQSSCPLLQSGHHRSCLVALAGYRCK
jgi:hypothetical protein